MKIYEVAVCCALTISLTACSGGGSGDPVGPVDTMETSTGMMSDPENPIDTGGTTNIAVFPPVYATPAGVEECSTDDIKRRVDFDMRDYYVYYDRVPTLNLDDYDSPERLIRDLRVNPDIYSFVTDAQEQEDLVEGGVSGGFGFWFNVAADDAVRFREVQVGSPAEDAGILRGDEILTFNGEDIEDVSNADIREGLDPDNAPVTLTIRTGDDAAREVVVDHDEFAWRTAGPAVRFSSSSDPSLPVVGYLPIRIFLETTRDDIDNALAGLEAAGGFDELIVDLRYNPGGRTAVTRRIASIVGGAAVANEVFLIRQWNDKYSENNSTDFFDDIEDPLNLPRVIALVTEFSSSASEVFVNTLEPYIDVVVVGGVTSGKPFTSNSRVYCDKSINAMRSLRTNAVGVSVAGGIQPDCPVQDDWQFEQSDTRDPLLDTALGYIARGACPVVNVATSAPTTRSANRSTLSFRPPEILVSEE